MIVVKRRHSSILQVSHAASIIPHIHSNRLRAFSPLIVQDSHVGSGCSLTVALHIPVPRLSRVIPAMNLLWQVSNGITCHHRGTCTAWVIFAARTHDCTMARFSHDPGYCWGNNFTVQFLLNYEKQNIRSTSLLIHHTGGGGPFHKDTV